MVRAFPDLLAFGSEAEYRAYYESESVHGLPIVTFDGITVEFHSERFDHAFYRDTTRKSHDKGRFDWDRAARMGWIKSALEDSSLENYCRVMGDRKVRRITLATSEKYAVITQVELRNPTRARFITAYIVDSPGALAKMRSNPRW